MEQPFSTSPSLSALVPMDVDDDPVVIELSRKLTEQQERKRAAEMAIATERELMLRKALEEFEVRQEQQRLQVDRDVVIIEVELEQAKLDAAARRLKRDQEAAEKTARKQEIVDRRTKARAARKLRSGGWQSQQPEGEQRSLTLLCVDGSATGYDQRTLNLLYAQFGLISLLDPSPPRASGSVSTEPNLAVSGSPVQESLGVPVVATEPAPAVSVQDPLVVPVLPSGPPSAVPGSPVSPVPEPPSAVRQPLRIPLLPKLCPEVPSQPILTHIIPVTVPAHPIESPEPETVVPVLSQPLMDTEDDEPSSPSSTDPNDSEYLPSDNDDPEPDFDTASRVPFPRRNRRPRARPRARAQARLLPKPVPNPETSTM